MDTMIQRLSQELGRPLPQVENVVRLIDEGNTIPFIARYRKELHGSMDDQLLRERGRAPPVPAESGGPESRGAFRH